MNRKLIICIIASLALAGCASDINVNKDVDFMNQDQANISRGDALPPTPEPTLAPTPSPSPAAAATASAAKQTDTIVDLVTSKGTIRLKLYADTAPKTVANFIAKAKSGYYKNLTFHRVEDWVIQGGDPLGTGTGGGKMDTELSQMPFKTGSLGVARGGDIKVSNDSQFFICTTDCSWLTGGYTNFGEVVTGMDIATKIAIGDKIISVNPIP